VKNLLLAQFLTAVPIQPTKKPLDGASTVAVAVIIAVVIITITVIIILIVVRRRRQQ